MIYGSEKAVGETDRMRRFGYRLLGELHIPGRLRIWHVIRELKARGLWGASNLRVLDAGGGEGAFAHHLARRFPDWQVVVMDNEPATLDRARRIKEGLGLANLEICRADLETFDSDPRLDLVICSDVLEHIEDDRRVVANLTAALKPGGILIVTAPSVPQPRHLPLVAWRERRIGFTSKDYGHVRQGYSETDLHQMFRQNELETERVRRTFGPFGTLMFDLFFITGDNHPNPLVFGVLLPFYFGLAALDLVLPSKGGAAILGVAKKP